MIRASQYDSDDWVELQTRLLRQQFVNAFWRQLDKLPVNDAKCAFLMSRGLYGRGPAEPTSTDIFNSPAGSSIDFAYRGAQHKKPEGASQKACDNLKKLGDLTANIEDAVRSNNLDAGMTAVFGPQWLTFKSTHDPDNSDGLDNN